MSARRLPGPLALAVAVLAATTAALAPLPSPAAPLRDVAIEARQPNGRVLRLRATGDEARRRVHDADGYTVMQDPATRRIVYATLRDGRLAPTGLEPGRDDPRTLRVAPGLDEPPEVIRQQVAAWQGARPTPRRSAPTAGLLNNIVLFVRFQDEAPLQTPVKAWEDMLNSLDPATPSLRAYYREASYGALEVVSHLLPAQDGPTLVSWQDENPRSYYQPRDPVVNPHGYGDAGDQMTREQQMVRRALEATVGDLPAGVDLDGDDDGFVDNLCVVVSGKPDGWNDLLWPHMSLQLADLIYLDDLIVLTYNLQLNDTVVDQARVGVLAHELFHTLGAPDLYHYADDKKTPVGPWDLMEWDLKVPQHMSGHLKTRYGHWMEPAPVITESGTYVLEPLTSPTGNGYLLPVPGQPKQFVRLEYRRRSGPYEASLPAEGLVAWRIDERWWGNNDGPPDEVYAFRPGGKPDADGDVRKAPFSAQAGRTTFDPGTDPFPFTQLGEAIGVRVTDVSDAGGDTMSFTVCMAYATCFLKECGDDGCGGTCGECAADRLCQDRLCVSEQRCDTLAACLSACAGDEACRTACARVPVACPAPVPCRAAGECDAVSGQCAYAPLEAGAPCDDGDKCTRDDACDGQGACLGSLDPACIAPEPLPEAAADNGPGDAAPPDTATADLPAADEGPAPDAVAPDEGTPPPDTRDPDATPADPGAGDAATADAAGGDLSPVPPAKSSGGCAASGGPRAASPVPWLLGIVVLAAGRRRRGGAGV